MLVCALCDDPAAGICKFCQQPCCENHLVWNYYVRGGEVVCLSCVSRKHGEQFHNYAAGKLIEKLSIVGYVPAMFCVAGLLWPESFGFAENRPIGRIAFSAGLMVCLLGGWLWSRFLKRIFRHD